MTPDYLLYELSLSGNAGWQINIHYHWDNSTYSDLYYKIYLDMLVYYLFIFFVCIVSFFSLRNIRIKLLLCQRVHIKFLSDLTVTIGEIIFWILWTILIIIEVYYWLVKHIYDTDSTKGYLERWARFTGILAILFATGLFLTVSRIRLWIDCFHVSFEHLVNYHRIFGYCMIICTYSHLFLFMAYFAVKYFCVCLYCSCYANSQNNKCFYDVSFFVCLPFAKRFHCTVQMHDPRRW